jgi:hypothetical protein
LESWFSSFLTFPVLAAPGGHPLKLNLKIDPYNYPLIIILAFVIGFVVAIALGFGPEHGSREMEHQILTLPILLHSLSSRFGETL